MIRLNRPSSSGMFVRRNKELAQTVCILVLLVSIGYSVYLYNSLQAKLQVVEAKSRNYQSQRQSLSLQVQKVYEDRARSQSLYDQERHDHIETKKNLQTIEEQHQQALETIERHKNDLDSLREDHFKLSDTHDNVKSDLEKSRAELSALVIEKEKLKHDHEIELDAVLRRLEEKEGTSNQLVTLQSNYDDLQKAHKLAKDSTEHLQTKLQLVEGDANEFKDLKAILKALGPDALNLEHRGLDGLKEDERNLLFRHFGGAGDLMERIGQHRSTLKRQQEEHEDAARRQQAAKEERDRQLKLRSQVNSPINPDPHDNVLKSVDEGKVPNAVPAPGIEAAAEQPISPNNAIQEIEDRPAEGKAEVKEDAKDTAQLSPPGGVGEMREEALGGGGVLEDGGVVKWEDNRGQLDREVNNRIAEIEHRLPSPGERNEANVMQPANNEVADDPQQVADSPQHVLEQIKEIQQVQQHLAADQQANILQLVQKQNEVAGDNQDADAEHPDLADDPGRIHYRDNDGNEQYDRGEMDHGENDRGEEVDMDREQPPGDDDVYGRDGGDDEDHYVDEDEEKEPEDDKEVVQVNGPPVVPIGDQDGGFIRAPDVGNQPGENEQERYVYEDEYNKNKDGYDDDGANAAERNEQNNMWQPQDGDKAAQVNRHQMEVEKHNRDFMERGF